MGERGPEIAVPRPLVYFVIFNNFD